MRVGVVGAGITGLATTHYLRQVGASVRTFEATARPGGVIRSERVEGHLLEYGPQRLRLSGELAELVSELSLEGALREADESLPLYVYADGRLRTVPRSLSAFVRTDALSVRAKLRVLLEPFTDEARHGESAGEFLERKFGSETYRTLIEPLLGGIYASDPREMPVVPALAPVRDLEARHGSLLLAAIRRVIGRRDRAPPISFDAGLETLPRALSTEHEAAISLNAPVEAIHPEPNGAGYILGTDDDETTVDAVVVTTPATAAADLLESVPTARAAPLRSLRYNPLAIVHLHADTDAAGFGYQVRRDAGLETLGVTWNDSLFDRDGVYTAFLGGMWDSAVLERPDAELGEMARKEFETIMDAPATVIDVETWPAAIPAYDTSWTALNRLELPDGITIASNYTGRIGVPGRLRDARRTAQRLRESSP